MSKTTQKPKITREVTPQSRNKPNQKNTLDDYRNHAINAFADYVNHIRPRGAPRVQGPPAKIVYGDYGWKVDELRSGVKVDQWEIYIRVTDGIGLTICWQSQEHPYIFWIDSTGESGISVSEDP